MTTATSSLGASGSSSRWSRGPTSRRADGLPQGESVSRTPSFPSRTASTTWSSRPRRRRSPRPSRTTRPTPIPPPRITSRAIDDDRSGRLRLQRAIAGDLIYVSVDNDPDMDGVATDTTIGLFSISLGALVVQTNGSAAVSSTRTPTLGSLTANTAFSPGEALVYRAPISGTYTAADPRTSPRAPATYHDVDLERTARRAAAGSAPSTRSRVGGNARRATASAVLPERTSPRSSASVKTDPTPRWRTGRRSGTSFRARSSP